MEDYDKTNVCFICNLEKYIFLKRSISFEQHIGKDHNMWNYVFFMYNLKRKNIVDMNGIESYIYEKIQNNDITWIPLRRALVLEQEISEETKLKDSLIKLNNKIKDLMAN